MTKFVSYLRVSTSTQGKSGLGLEAQREAIRLYLERVGKLLRVDQASTNPVDASCVDATTACGSSCLEFLEIESGGNNDRPKLKEALAMCQATGATLVVAKLDRLARNVAFLAQLMDSGVDFVAVDNPDANRLTIHILAAVAENERVVISDRIKAALAAAKVRGTKLGDHANGGAGSAALRAYVGRHGTTPAMSAIRKNADDFARNTARLVEQARGEGCKSLAAIAGWLNDRGIKTRRGGQWHHATVKNLLARMPA